MKPILNNAALISVFAVAISLSQAKASTYYVASTGDDNGPGTLARPFLAIQKCGSAMIGGDTCLIRGGIYRETVTPARSGSAGSPITFDAHNGERVVVSGANVLTGFTAHSGSIYKAPMTSIGAGMDQILIGGAVQPEARFPDVAAPGLEYPVAELNARNSVWPARGYFSVPNSSQVTSASLTGNTPGLFAGGLYVGRHYASFQFQKADITASASGSLTVSPLPGKWYTPPFWDGEHGRGFISGTLSAISLPGEWALKNGVLFVQLPEGKTPSSTVIEAKLANWLSTSREKTTSISEIWKSSLQV